jgi:hypothetical protein
VFPYFLSFPVCPKAPAAKLAKTKNAVMIFFIISALRMNGGQLFAKQGSNNFGGRLPGG